MVANSVDPDEMPHSLFAKVPQVSSQQLYKIIWLDCVDMQVGPNY